MKLKKIDITRPDKIIISGIKSIGHFTQSLYAEEKSIAKGKGEITFIGEKKVEEVKSQHYKYSREASEISEGITDFSFFSKIEDKEISWLNIHGLHDVELIQKLAKAVRLDRITLVQTLDTTMRPKVEEHDHYLFFSIKSMLKTEKGSFIFEQLSFILGSNYVISFQEQTGDHFDHIRNKISEDLGVIRKKGADYLLYQLLDATLDNYFETIEKVNNEIKGLERDILRDPAQDDLIQLERIKQFAEMIKKSLNPFKESLRVINSRETHLINAENRKFYHDLLSSCLAAIEEVDTTVKSIEGLTNIYFSSLSQKMNETMKVLTTVATIFIPLTFIAGIYGMNFDNMPELHHPNGYFYVWGAMGLVFLGMIVYFKRKKWL